MESKSVRVATETKQPPRGFARRLFVRTDIREGADFSNSVPR